MPNFPKIHRPPRRPFIGGIPNIFPGEGPNGSKYPLDCSIWLPASTSDARNSTGILHGIGNAWSWSFWSVRLTAPTADVRQLVIGPSSGTINEIGFWNINTGDGRDIRLYDSAGTLFKSYQFSSTNQGLTTVMNNHVITWDGTTLLYYINGILETPSGKVTDDAGTMTDTARGMTVGGGWAGTEACFDHPHAWGVWNTALTAQEAASLYCNGFGHQANLNENFEDYASSASLVHFYRFSLDTISAATRGTDYASGPAAVPYNPTTTANSGWVTAAVGGLVHAAEAPGVQMAPTTAYLANTALNKLDMSNVMTWAVYYHSTNVSTLSYLLDVRTSGSANNRIELIFDGADTTNPFTFRVTDSSGNTIKDYDWDFLLTKQDSTAQTPPTAFMFVVTWDGPNNICRGFHNGRFFPVSVIVTNVNSSARTDTPVSVWVGSRFDGTIGCAGRMGFIAGWDKILTDDEIRIIFNAGYPGLFDRTINSLGYYSADNLRHNWIGAGRPRSFYGLGTGTFCADLVEAGRGINVEVNKPVGMNRADSNQNSGLTLLRQGTNFKLTAGTYFGNFTPSVLGFGNAWTIQFDTWIAALTSTLDLVTISTGTGSTANSIRIYNKDTVTRALGVQMWDQNGVLFKDYLYNAYSAAATRNKLTLTWDGTTLTMYKDGTAVAANVKTVDLTGSQANTARGMVVNRNYNPTSLGSNALDRSDIMNISGIAIWNKALSANTVLGLSGQRDIGRVNLRKPIASFYTGSDPAALVHWWRFCADPHDLGRDLIPTFALNLGTTISSSLLLLQTASFGIQMQGEAQD